MFNFIKRILNSGEVRVRIAPSPTGYLHIGTARTALFNWLFAKKHNGKFILRIEDTDLARSDTKYERDIIEGLTWLGLEWDEGPTTAAQNQNAKIKIQNYKGEYGPYRQSERLSSYAKYLKKLLQQNRAYFCDCTKEDLERERQEQIESGKSPKYSGKCRDKKVSEDRAQLIRFKINPGKVIFNDLIRGEIVFDAELIGDMAIAKNIKTPLYNFAVVIDDYTMKISHVIRGEDHIANTPKQILLQQALGFPEPKYGHLPLILDPDRSKMSKRYSATSVREFKDQGYLAESLVNFMALLGWHPSEENKSRRGEKMGISEIIKQFSLNRVQKGGAIFDVKKLDWLNSQYIQEASPEKLLDLLAKTLSKNFKQDKDNILKILKIGKARMNKLTDFNSIIESFNLTNYEKELLNWKDTPFDQTRNYLEKTKEILEKTPRQDFNQKKLEEAVIPFANAEGRGEVLWPLRVALSGKSKSPGPFEIMEVIEKEEALRRLKIALEKIK